jgi:hypothetical protein
MIPAKVLAALGTTVAKIVETAAEALNLRDIYLVAKGGAEASARGIFQRFVNLARQAGLSLAEAQGTWPIVRYWGQQGDILSQYDPSIPIDPMLARPVKGAGQYAGEFGGFTTRVDAAVTHRQTGEVYKISVWVRTDLSPTLEDLFDRASDLVRERIGESPQLVGERAVGELTVEMKVGDFAMFRHGVI